MRNRLMRHLFLSAALLSFGAASFAQNSETKTPATVEEFKSAKPQNTTGDRKFESIIATIDDKNGVTKITLNNGGMTLIIKSETEVVREERDLVASDLKVGDAICFAALKGARKKLSISEKSTVTGIAPLKMRIGEMAEMTFLKSDVWEFNRAVPLQTSDLQVGQTVAVQIRLQRDGDIATKRVAVVVAKPKAPRSRKKNAEAKASAGNQN